LEAIMEATFKRDEVISATSAAKNFGKVVSDLANHKKDKAVIIKNNEITAVILPAEEYEYMAELVQFVEHVEIFDIITKRKKKAGKRIPLEKLLKEERIEL
jgi:PHD/YefM family antitoxin component YafN of YafNO toxin-antitoxin module